MKYITKTWSRFLISLFGGGLLSELMFISTGDPNRQRGAFENSMPLIFGVLLYLTFSLIVDNRTVKFSEIVDDTKEIVPLKIYSKTAILIFSFFFSPLFSGFLLRQNLVEVKNKNAGNIILLLSFLLTMITVDIMAKWMLKIPFLLNLIFIVLTLIMTQYVFNKYFPDKNYKYKKVWKPLIIGLSILFGLMIMNVTLRSPVH